MAENIVDLYEDYLLEAIFIVSAWFSPKSVPNDPLLILADDHAAGERDCLEPFEFARRLLPLPQASAVVWLMEATVMWNTCLADQRLECYRAGPRVCLS